MIDKFPSEIVTSTDNCLTVSRRTSCLSHTLILWQYTLRQPWGVCAGILPFNGPMATFAMKVAPALACGNSLVVKTSETNPLSTLFMASLANEAGIPVGALNCLTGGAEAGHAIASHMKIRKISFTGSVNVGKLVHVAAAQSNLKSVTTELGGKSANIVFADADLEKAVPAAAMFIALNGQGCSLPTRLYLHESIAEEFIAKLVPIVEGHAKTLGGNPTSVETKGSPLFYHRQREMVLSYIESGRKEATLVTGGNALGDKGCYIEPTIFVDPKPDARILREEIFGPVLTVIRFSSEEEVLKLANDTEYGLAGYLWTRDIKRAMRMSRKLEAGNIGVNGAGGLGVKTPVGGWKREY